jgi:hypothetical protein
VLINEINVLKGTPALYQILYQGACRSRLILRTRLMVRGVLEYAPPHTPRAPRKPHVLFLGGGGGCGGGGVSSNQSVDDYSLK